MKNKMRKELKIGLLLIGIYIALNRFTSTPEFILGALCGLGLCFETIGILPVKAYNSFKNWKKKYLTTRGSTTN